jgi:hypothetical protein
MPLLTELCWFCGWFYKDVAPTALQAIDLCLEIFRTEKKVAKGFEICHAVSA